VIDEQYDGATLLQVGVPDEPDGFAEFWTGLHNSALAVAPEPELTPVAGIRGHDVFEVRFSSLGGVRLGGWVTLPADRLIEYALVVSHGYGGRTAPELEWTPRLPIADHGGPALPDRTAVIYPVARGQPALSTLPGIPSEPREHVLVGIESVDTYIHGDCAADVWCAASALLEILPAKPQRLDYVGGSFGGGIGALALPWDDRFDAAVLRHPSFDNHDVRLMLPCTGSGESVRQHVMDHPSAREVLRFFDAAVAARRLTIPTLVAAALRDPAVPPPGQFAVYNAITAEKTLYVFSAGHTDYPDLQAEHDGFLTALQKHLRP
jgi:cephalosporin-C deacetylase